MNESDVIGQRGRIIGDHPRSGRVGTIVRVERTPVGYGAVVRLDQQGASVGAAEEAFVFDPHRHWAQLRKDAK